MTNKLTKKHWVKRSKRQFLSRRALVMFTDTEQRHQCRMCHYCRTHDSRSNPRRAKDATLAQNWDEWDLWSLSIWSPGTLNYIPLFGICICAPLLWVLEHRWWRSLKTPLIYPCHNPSSTTDRLTPRRILGHGDEPVWLHQCGPRLQPQTHQTGYLWRQNTLGLNSAFAKGVLRSTKLQTQVKFLLKTHCVRWF